MASPAASPAVSPAVSSRAPLLVSPPAFGIPRLAFGTPQEAAPWKKARRGREYEDEPLLLCRVTRARISRFAIATPSPLSSLRPARPPPALPPPRWVTATSLRELVSATPPHVDTYRQLPSTALRHGNVGSGSTYSPVLQPAATTPAASQICQHGKAEVDAPLAPRGSRRGHGAFVVVETCVGPRRAWRRVEHGPHAHHLADRPSGYLRRTEAVRHAHRGAGVRACVLAGRPTKVARLHVRMLACIRLPPQD